VYRQKLLSSRTHGASSGTFGGSKRKGGVSQDNLTPHLGNGIKKRGNTEGRRDIREPREKNRVLFRGPSVTKDYKRSQESWHSCGRTCYS